MLRHPDYTRNRLAQIAPRMEGKIYAQRRAADQILVSGRVDRIAYAEAQKLAYRPAKLGQEFGPQWATFWFKVKATAPKEWAGERVDLLWVSQSEATLWVDGKSVQGLNKNAGDRPDALLTARARGGQKFSLDVEMACNQKFGTWVASPLPDHSPYVLTQCEIARFDPEAWDLYHDYIVLQELEAEQKNEPKDLDRTWAGELLYELNRFANLYDENDRSTWAPARRILKELYSRRNGTRVHELSAIGHAHIDTAWLWPLAETYRKCERTFSSQTAYMDAYRDYKFSCSQAQQYAWIKGRNPDLYKRIKEKVKGGQFVPVGGTWVEPDCNIPSGESLARQFLHGQRFFEREFGKRCSEFWNPDVFGYNGQLPQLMRLAGIQRFLTQKLSWNYFNKPQHHTFTWQGIDGSEVLAHFPPADTYNAMADVKEIRRNAREYKDHDRSRHSFMLFGFGDGGGGPTKRMIETLRRAKDLQGLPRTQMRSSEEFFDLLEKDCADRPTLIGELYFEFHRGTYTTQAATKKGNRQSEFLLHDIEFLASAAVALEAKGYKYPAAELDRLWKLVLLNQFHDILPGSSITLVYDDAKKHYAEIRESGERLRGEALAALASVQAKSQVGGESLPTPVNTIGFSREEVAQTPQNKLVFIEAPSYGFGRIAAAPDAVSIIESKAGVVLANGHLRARIASDGRVLSLVERSTGREALAGPANMLQLFEDKPTAFEAWDVDPFHLETVKDCPPAESMKIARRSALRAEVKFERTIGEKSRASQIIRLDAGARRLEFHTDVDWRESNKFLKAGFPLNVRAMNATYEMQFGCVERPTHYNTTFDLARFEVPGHRWADLSEHGFGVALLSESKYGFSTFGNLMRISLLRSTKAPDPNADMGRHRFAYALMPHGGDWRQAGVVREAMRFNVPVQWTSQTVAPRCFASVDDPNLVLDTVKQAEDSDGIILRLYECHGARGVTGVKINLPFTRASFANILEDEGAVAKIKNGQIEVPYTPFQIITLKLT
ncbi:MAG TPA: alpha-mannosidase [Tepidisphaeraceae bacterium]|jgi:alpha-mannosidase